MTWWRRGELHPEVVNLRSLLHIAPGSSSMLWKTGELYATRSS